MRKLLMHWRNRAMSRRAHTSIAFTAALAALLPSCANHPSSTTQPSTLAPPNASKQTTLYVFRLNPGADLRRELEAYTKSNRLSAAVIVSAVGSLTKATLRLAEEPNPTNFDGPFEIVSLVGTLSPDGPHLHIAIADKTGRTIGGHLLDGCTIRTTAEIAIAVPSGLRFERKLDPQTGYRELSIQSD